MISRTVASRLRGTSLLVLIGLLLTACAPSAAPAPTAAPTTAAAPKAAAQPTAAPAAKPAAATVPAAKPAPAAAPTGELVVGIATDPQTMDPRISSATSSWAMLRHIYEPLVFRDDKMNIIPVLAESWTRVDPTTWEIRLRRGVKFHNGEDFDARSVKYTIESILDKDNKWVNSQFPGYIAAIDKVDIKDDYSVLIRTKQPSGSLMHNLTVIEMLPPKLGAEANDKFSASAVGTGPFKIVEYVSNSRLVVEAFDGYWGTAPKVRRITFRILPENATRLAALESGEAHLINNLPADAVDRVKGSTNLQVLSAPSNRIIHLGLQAERPPFNDVRVRQALNYAVDKQSLVQDLMGGLADVATGPMHPTVFGFNDQLKPYTYDPAKARELLAQAGYPNGLTIKFGYPTGRYLSDKQVGEAIVGQLAKVGITADAETAEWGTYFANRNQGKYDAFLYGFGAPTVHPDFALQWFGRTRFTKYENPTVDKLLADADAEFDQAKAIEMYKQAQQIIWDEAAWVFLYYQPELYGASKRLQGFAPRSDEYFLLWDASLN